MTKFRRFHLPLASLLLLLQRTPAVRLAATAGEFVAPTRIVALLKSALAAAASLGAVQSLAGATQFVVSAPTVNGTTGIAITPVAFTVIGAQTPAGSFRVTSLPPGLTLTNGNANGVVNASSASITGTPTTAGTYTTSILAYEKLNATGDSFGPTRITFNIAQGAAPPPAAPAITTQPQSQFVTPGSPITLSVAASGTGLSYQWKRDGTAIAGANAATYGMPSAGSASVGFYSVTVTNATGAVDSAVAIVNVNAGGSSRLANVSTRGYVPAGGSLTPGFVLQGTGTKSVVIRAIGPTLGSFGVGGTLSDPMLDVIPLGATNTVASNDNWDGALALQSAFTRVGAFPLAAPTSSDASVETSLNANGATGYTVRITSKTTAGAGIALAEVYDEEALTAPVRLVNVSTSGFVGTGEQALVPGFFIAGTASKLLLVRAVGPGLAQFGVGGVLANPQLSLVPLGKDFAVAANDNWGGDAALQAAFAQAGAFNIAAGSNDAAVVVRLPPGGYTVVVSGVGNTTGTALVEIYDLDP